MRIISSRALPVASLITLAALLPLRDVRATQSVPMRVTAIAVSIYTTANVHPFSPLIFGVAYGDATRDAQIGYPIRRWGGNSTTRYNWQVDVHSTAADYYYENIPGESDRTHVPPLGNDADAFVIEEQRHRTGGGAIGVS